MRDELKPCPFCGDDNLGHKADCYLALCMLPDMPAPSVMEAAWNRRALSHAAGQEVGHMHDYGDRVRVVWDKPWQSFPAGTRFYTAVARSEGEKPDLSPVAAVYDAFGSQV